MAHRDTSVTNIGGWWDLAEGFRSWRLWAFMGLVDIRQRYRRSMLGPLWMALGLGVTVLGMGLLYSQVFDTDASRYVPFIAISFLAWQFMTAVLIDGTTLFANATAIITSVRVPYSTFILRSIVRNLIVAAHASVVVMIAFVWYGNPIGPAAIVSLLGLALLCVNLFWMTLVIALLSARFRDVAQIITYVLGLMMFLTPVIWIPDAIHPGSPFLLYNPFAHLLSIIREPVLNGVVPVVSFGFAAGFAAIGLPVSAIVFSRLRRYVAYWT